MKPSLIILNVILLFLTAFFINESIKNGTVDADTIIYLIAVFVWITVAIIVGQFGKKRTIGFAGAFFASLLLSPVLAMLFVLATDKK